MTLGCGFISILLISRLMNKDDSGAFFTVITLLISLSLYSRIGYDKGLIPLISNSKNVNIKTRNLVRTVIFCLYGNILAVAVLLFYQIDHFLIYLIMPFITVNNIFVAYFKSVSKPNTSFLFDSSFVYCILLIPLSIFLFLGINISLNQIFMIYISSVISQNYILLYLVRKERLNFKFDLHDLNISFYEYIKDVYKMRYFLFITVLANLSRLLPILFLSVFFMNNDISNFKVIEQIAMSGTIIITVVNSIYSIKYVENRLDLDKILTSVFHSSAISIIFSIIYFLIIYIFGSYILEFAKVEVSANKDYFTIMIIATFINIVSAPVYNALTMIGKERSALLVLIFSIISFATTLLLSAYFQNIILVYNSVLIFYISQFLVSVFLFWKYCNAIK